MKTIDFSGKRVKVDGKSVSKYELACLCDKHEAHYYNRYNVTLYLDAFNYDWFKDRLRSLITERQSATFTNVIL